MRLSSRRSHRRGAGTFHGVLACLAAALCFHAHANQVTFQVNMAVQMALGRFDPANGDSVLVSGTFSTPDWSTTSTLSPSVWDTNIYIGTFNNNVSAGTLQFHKFVINPGGNSPANGLIWESGDNRFFQVTAANQVRPVVFFDDLTNAPVAPTNANLPFEFLAGADLSHLAFFEDRGAVYRADGQVQDALLTLKQRGLNCVRLRLFTSSAAQAAANPYNAINNLDYTIPLAVRVKNAGFKFLLDFHYSDSWADPGKQTRPSAWTNLSFAELKSEIRSYTSNSIAALKAAGAEPDFVQVGNEITPGMLWNDGRVGGAYDTTTQWSQLSQLLTNAIQGVKDVSGIPAPFIIIHIDRGGDWTTTQWFFDNLAARQVPFDILAQSYYPFWHGDLNALRVCLNNSANRYGKPVIVMETAFPYSNSTNIVGIPATTNGQVRFLVELAKIVKGVPGGLGAGIFWWGAEYQQIAGYNLAGFERRSMFGSGGDVLPVADAFGALAAPIALSPTVSNNLLILKWPLSGAGLSLKSTSNLAAPQWTIITNAVQNTGTVFSTSLPLESDASRFFRLLIP